MPNRAVSQFEPEKRPATERQIRINRVDGDRSDKRSMSLAVEGALSIQTLSAAWSGAIDPVREAKPGRVVIDAAGLDYCDGAGLGLLIEMRRLLAGWGGELTIEHLKPELERLINMSVLADPSAPQLRPPRRDGLATSVGQATAVMLADLYAMVAFLGQITAAVLWSVFHPRQLRWKDLLTTADKVGSDAVPVVCLLGFIIGAILAFQAAPALAKFGGRDFIPTLVSFSVVRELGPLIASILMAGRTASAFAAELGTMKVTEEVSALTAMGLDPVNFLAVPRVLAAIIVSPVLGVISSLMGVLGGYVVMVSYGFTLSRYVSQVHTAVNYKDLIGAELKTLVFGLIIGGIGCLRGLRTGNGPGAVGDSTTRAVVSSIVLIIIADGIFGVIYFYLGL